MVWHLLEAREDHMEWLLFAQDRPVRTLSDACLASIVLQYSGHEIHPQRRNWRASRGLTSLVHGRAAPTEPRLATQPRQLFREPVFEWRVERWE
jgi:hypothetical protein